MYCPNCGQQQASNEMRFCSRCGLALSGLADWISGGSLVSTPTPQTPAPAPTAGMSPRRKNIRRAAKLMFFSGALFPIFLMIALAENEGAAMIVPFFLFFISLAWMLYARLFSDPNPKVDRRAQSAQLTQSVQPAQPPYVAPTPARSSLPPPAAIPISDLRGPQLRTNELAQPPSVTENTTRFFDKE